MTSSLRVRAVADLPTTVVIRDLSDCRAIFSFRARDRGPGGGYTVFVGQGRTFDLMPGTGFSEGPYVGPSSGDRCPDLPDTSTAGAGTMGLADAVAALLGRLLAAIRDPLSV